MYFSGKECLSLELLKVVQRGLQYKGEAVRYVEEEINQLLLAKNVSDKDEISRVLANIFGEKIIVNSLKILKRDNSGNSLKKYLEI